MKRSFYILLLMLLTLTASAAEKAAPFSLPTRDGNISLGEQFGTVVYVDFWASWCGPCRKSFPWMNDMQERYGERGFKVIAINLDKETELAARFLKDVPAQFTIAYDPEGKVADLYKVQAMPSSYLIDRQGNLHSTHLGFKQNKADDMEMEIRQLLSQ